MSYEVGDWGKLYGHKFHLCVNPIFMINAEDTSKTKYIQPCFELPLKIRIKFTTLCAPITVYGISASIFFFERGKLSFFGSHADRISLILS